MTQEVCPNKCLNLDQVQLQPKVRERFRSHKDRKCGGREPVLLGVVVGEVLCKDSEVMGLEGLSAGKTFES